MTINKELLAGKKSKNTIQSSKDQRVGVMLDFKLIGENQKVLIITKENKKVEVVQVSLKLDMVDQEMQKDYTHQDLQIT